MKKFTYIIPFNSKIDDINNLRKVIKWVNGWNDIELIVVEYDTTTKLESISDPFTHIFVKNSDTNYSKSWAYNIGLKRSISDVVICGDSSTMTNPENLMRGMEMIKKHSFVRPFNRIYEINHTQLKSFDEMDKSIIGNKLGLNDDRVEYLCTGITIFNKETLLKIGGWEERFNIECSEDFQSHKVKNLTNWVEMDGIGYKLNTAHPHSDDLVTLDVNVNNSLKSLKQDQLVRYVSTTYQNLGVLSKYE